MTYELANRIDDILVTKTSRFLVEPRGETILRYGSALRKKLLEEAHEVLKSVSKDELIDELGDVYEVLHLLEKLHAIDPVEVQEKRAKKNEERGSYTGRQFVTVVEYPVGSYGAQCCLAEPDLYPEILED